MNPHPPGPGYRTQRARPDRRAGASQWPRTSNRFLTAPAGSRRDTRSDEPMEEAREQPDIW